LGYHRFENKYITDETRRIPALVLCWADEWNFIFVFGGGGCVGRGVVSMDRRRRMAEIK
jgi:hypothetical protein